MTENTATTLPRFKLERGTDGYAALMLRRADGAWVPWKETHAVVIERDALRLEVVELRKRLVAAELREKALLDGNRINAETDRRARNEHHMIVRNLRTHRDDLLVQAEWALPILQRHLTHPNDSMALDEYATVIMAVKEGSKEVVDMLSVEDVLKAAGQEYILNHVIETDDTRVGRHSTVRGMMVRLGLYPQLEDAINAAYGNGLVPMDPPQQAAPGAPEGDPTPAWWPKVNAMGTAPKDGTLLRLLVDYREDGANAIEDAGLAWTIGFNNLQDTDEDRWDFAGWNWEQDCFTQGEGEVVGWAPFYGDTLPASGKAHGGLCEDEGCEHHGTPHIGVSRSDIPPELRVMDAASLIAAHDAAYDKARGCPVYAPPHSVNPGEALYHATRAGLRSAACGDEWMRLYSELKMLGLRSLKHPQLFKDTAIPTPAQAEHIIMKGGAA